MQVIVAESTDNFCNYIYFLQSKLGEMMMMMTKPSGGPIRQRGGAGSGGPSVRFNCEPSARAQAGA